MNSKQLTCLALPAAIAATLMSGALYAQQTSQTTPTQSSTTTTAPSSPGAHQAANAKNASTLQQVVVTGTATMGRVKKIDAAYSITSMTSEQIKEANPKSAADLLKASPGIFPDHPAARLARISKWQASGRRRRTVRYVPDGWPRRVYPMALSFLDQSSFMRIPDDTIGPRRNLYKADTAVLYGNGSAWPDRKLHPSRKAPMCHPADIGFTYGSEGMERLDGFIGFKVANNWYGSVGGLVASFRRRA